MSSFFLASSYRTICQALSLVKRWIESLLPGSLREKLDGPIAELTAHFLLSLCAVVFISITERVLHWLQLADKPIPILGMPLSEWMFDMDVLAVSLILMVGLIKALREMW